MGTAVSSVNRPDERRERMVIAEGQTVIAQYLNFGDTTVRHSTFLKRFRSMRTASIAGVVALAACVSTSNHGNPVMAGAAPSPALSEGPRALYIGRADLTNTGQETLADVVLHLRPDWLRWNPTSRGTTGEPARASVYTNGTYSGETEVLRTIPPEVVVDARYLPPVEARNRFGSACHCAGGVILVRTRSDRD